MDFSYHLQTLGEPVFPNECGKQTLRQRSWWSFFFHSKNSIVPLSLFEQLYSVKTVHIISAVSNVVKNCSFSYQGSARGNHSGTDVPASERNTEPEMQENRHSIYNASSQINLVYAKTTPGSYCHHNYYQQTNVGDWNPEPINGILIQEGKLTIINPKTCTPIYS